jgi:hypothetical protein
MAPIPGVGGVQLLWITDYSRSCGGGGVGGAGRPVMTVVVVDRRGAGTLCGPEGVSLLGPGGGLQAAGLQAPWQGPCCLRTR